MLSKVITVAMAVTTTVVYGASCADHCRSAVLGAKESECAEWREARPRPELYNRCEDGFMKGASVGCDEYCSPSPSEGSLAEHRLNSCEQWRGSQPRELMTACLKGFSKAVSRAKANANYDPAEFHASVVESGAIPDSEAHASEGKKRRRLNVKKAQQPPKNVLEEAREEAAAAFEAATTIGAEETRMDL